jgi:hypothetical protein
VAENEDLMDVDLPYIGSRGSPIMSNAGSSGFQVTNSGALLDRSPATGGVFAVTNSVNGTAERTLADSDIPELAHQPLIPSKVSNESIPGKENVPSKRNDVFSKEINPLVKKLGGLGSSRWAY